MRGSVEVETPSMPVACAEAEGSQREPVIALEMSPTARECVAAEPSWMNAACAADPAFHRVPAIVLEMSTIMPGSVAARFSKSPSQKSAYVSQLPSAMESPTSCANAFS